MQPSQVAALLGREIDTGFAAALADLGSSRSVVVERIVARVGAVPGRHEGTETDPTPPDWDLVPWQAEVTLRPGDPAPTAPTEGESAEQPSLPDSPAEALRRRIAALPTGAVRGVGPWWQAELSRWGVRTLADLADADPDEILRRAPQRALVVLPMLSRARDVVAAWPPLTPALLGRSIVEIAATPAAKDSPGAHVVRAHCLRLTAALDAPVAARLVLR